MPRKVLTVTSDPLPALEIYSVSELGELVPGPGWKSAAHAKAETVARSPWKNGAKSDDVYVEVTGALRITYDGGMLVAPGAAVDVAFWWDVAQAVKARRDGEGPP